jgi:hypothetical protein
MKNVSFLPCDILKPFIRSFVISEAEQEGTYKVLPDTGLVIGFQYKGTLQKIENDKSASLAISGITGLADHTRTFRNSNNIGTVLVFFREAGAAQFFRQPLHELFRESVSLDNFMLRSELLFLEEELAEAKTDNKRISAVERFLVARMKTSNPISWYWLHSP